jgi:hypothetical protein
VDIAYVEERTVFPVEVKWTSQIRPADLKQIMSYPDGLILGRLQAEGQIERIKVKSLIQFLIHEGG